MLPNFIIIDFDSTFISKESLDELASHAIKRSKTKDLILDQIHQLTNDGMNGKITFDESIDSRLKLINATKEDVDFVSKNLNAHISDSFMRNKNFIIEHSDKIYIISGGFKEILIPVLTSFGIPEKNIFGNDFIYDGEKIISFNSKNPLTKSDGKAKVIESLSLNGDIHAIGDGYNDYQLKASGFVTKFFAFTENIYRKEVCDLADKIIGSLDEYIDYVNE